MRSACRWAIAFATLTLAVAACGTNHRSSTATTTAVPVTTAVPITTGGPATAAPPTIPPAVTSPPTAATSPATSTPPGRPCTVPDLSVSLTAPLGSAGAFHYQLVFKSISSSACTMFGFPGVSFLDSNGRQIGPPAKEASTAARQRVTLAPGADGYATLDVTDPGIPPCAGPETVARIRVYPPGSYVATSAAPVAGMQVCTSPNTPSYTATKVGPVTGASVSGYNP